MSPLVPVMVAGIVATAWVPQLPPAGAALGTAVGGLAMLALHRPLAHLGAGLALGVAVAVLYGHGVLERRLPIHCEREPLGLSGRVASLPQNSRGVWGEQQRFEFEVEAVSPRSCSGPQKVLLTHYGDFRFRSGERWQVAARLHRPRGLGNAGGFDREAYLAQRGIDAQGSVRRGTARQLDDGVSHHSHHRLRATLSERIAALPLSPSSRAVLRAVTVADRSGLDHSLWRLCQAFGVNHLLVISGLHIGLVAGAGYLLGRLLALPAAVAGYPLAAMRIPALVAVLAATAYTALAGFSVPTLRALVMLACLVLASLCWRHATAWHSLLVAALLILLHNPLAGLGSGFWLSFLAVGSLLWLGQWQAQWHDRGQRFLQWLLSHGYMCLVMLPLGGLWFGGFSQVAAFANAALVPLLGVWVIPLALLGALAALCGMQLAGFFWSLAALPLELLIPAGMRLLDDHPETLFRPLATQPWEAGLAALAVALSVLPGATRLRLLAPVLLLPLLLPPRWPETATPASVHFTVIDVGQGTAVLVHDRYRALLYDTGGGVPGGMTLADSVLLPLLQRRGITGLDTLVISHGDLDHSAGLQSVLERLPVGEVLVGGTLAPPPGGERCLAGRSWRWPESGARFSLLSPALEPGLSSNDGSCVLQVSVAGTTFLLPGDITAGRERSLVMYWRQGLRSDWLLAAHHGSATSTSRAWLNAVQPSHVVHSRGYGNRFGHPHPDVIERVAVSGAEIWDTALDGAVEVVVDPEAGAAATAWRRGLQPYWR